MDPRLARLGFSAHFEAALAALPAERREGLVVARVTGQHRREWDVSGAEIQSRAYLAGKRWAGSLANEEAQPTIGDWVLVKESNGGGLPVISEILERKTSLVRGAAGGRGEKQVVAANVDLVLMVSALAAEGSSLATSLRSTNPRRLERYLTAIESGGARALFIVNKCDLGSGGDEIVSELRQRLGREVVATSTKGAPGIDELSKYLVPGETIGFIGMSGVGKSSIVNALFGREIQKTMSERASDARGRHTTTHRELFVLESGSLLIDTPGMREFSLEGADESDLAAFSDISDLAKECRFADCRHEKEPGCRVRPAVEDGTILPDRLAHYRTLKQELSETSKRSALRRPNREKRR